MTLFPSVTNMDMGIKDLDVLQLPNFLDGTFDEDLLKSLDTWDGPSWLGGSDFDLFLGHQTPASRAASVEVEVKQEQAQPASPPFIEGLVSQPASGGSLSLAAAANTSWGGFPSALFSSIPSANAPLLDADSSAQQPVGSLPEPSFRWQEGAVGEAGLDHTDNFASGTAPREDSTGSSGIDIPMGMGDKTASISPRSSSWKGVGVLKSKRSRPKQRGQVAELKEKVAELTAKCSTMERQLSSQSLNHDTQAHSPSSPVQLQSSLFSNRDQPQPVFQGLFPPQPTAKPMQDTSAQAGSNANAQASLDGITCNEFGNLYRSMVSQLAVRLVASPKDGEASDELKKMSSDVLLLVMRCCMENSVVAKMWMVETYKAEQARLEADKDGTRLWETTAKSLALSKEQKQAVVQLRLAFLQRLEALQRARRDIIIGLTGSAPSSFRHRASAVAQLQGLQRIEAYCANMKECDRLICDYVVTFHSQILQPTQFARCLVAAYPFWPDTLALGTYISADAGEKSAVAMLQEQFRGVSVAASSS